MPSPALYDGAHASMLEAYIRAKTAEGYRLLGTEMPYRRGKGYGYVDVVLRRQLPGAAAPHLLVAELKTVILNLGQALRQVNAAKEAFLASHGNLLTSDSPVTLDYPLVVWASQNNIQRLTEFAHVMADTTIEIFHHDKATATSMATRLEIQKAILRARARRPPPTVHAQQVPSGTLRSHNRQQDHHAMPIADQARLSSPRRTGRPRPGCGFIRWRFSEIRNTRRRSRILSRARTRRNSPRPNRQVR